MKILNRLNFSGYIKKLDNRGIEMSILGTILILMFTTLIAMQVDFFMNTIDKEHMLNAISSTQHYALVTSVNDELVWGQELILVPSIAESTFGSEIRQKLGTGSNSFYKTINWDGMNVNAYQLDKCRGTISTSLSYSPVQFVSAPSDTLFVLKDASVAPSRFTTRVKVVSAIYLYE